MYYFMLAYELWYSNRIRPNIPAPKGQFPIKKIFYKNNTITIDEKKIEEYGNGETKDTKWLQNLLQMPLNTSNLENINLPNYEVGSASPKPYIEAYGTLEKNRSALRIFIGKEKSGRQKSESIYQKHLLDFDSGKITSEVKGTVKLKLNKNNYQIGSKPLFAEYIKSGIIDEEGTLNEEAYDKIIVTFLEFAKKQKKQSDDSPIQEKKIGFRVYILPDSDKIEYTKSKTSGGNPGPAPFVDYFGIENTEYADKPTTTAKFITYDDKAFTINCKQAADFYKNLGIGSDVLVKVYVEPSQTFTINNLRWTFIALDDPDFKFKETKKGILTQLYQNYEDLKQNGKDSNLKIICIQKKQAKQEILIDENLTMRKMKDLFSKMHESVSKSGNIPPLCFESVLIDKSHKEPIWSTYVYVIRNFLAGNKVSKYYLLSLFNNVLKQRRYDWIRLSLNDKKEQEPQDFFLRTEFCMKHLISLEHSNITNMRSSEISPNEEFATRIGMIARTYIDFKQKNKESDNSLLDILTYSKYDRERLRFIVARIGRGVHLSKIDDDKKKEVTKKISTLQPNKEITEDAAFTDYSYFFFKGYYYTKSENETQ